jgi:hypothetical protein
MIVAQRRFLTLAREKHTKKTARPRSLAGRQKRSALSAPASPTAEKREAWPRIRGQASHRDGIGSSQLRIEAGVYFIER